MTDMTWLTEAWPWWMAFYLLIVYEFYALWSQYAHGHWPEQATHPKPSFLITLSRMYWRAHPRCPLVDPIMLSVLAWLVPHFLVGDDNGAAEWTWTVILWIAIWAWFIKRHGAD